MSPQFAFNLTGDMFDILISMILAISLVVESSGKGKLKQYFTRMVVLNILMTLCDSVEWIPHQFISGHAYQLVMTIGTMLYYVFFFALLCSFFLYECEYVTGAGAGVKLPRKIMIIYTIICCFVVVVTVPFGLPFTVDKTYHYVRGPLYIPIVCMLILQDIFCFYVPFASFRKMRIKELAFIFVYAAIPIVALLFQSSFKGYAIQNIATTLALLLAYINVQTELSFKNQQEQAEKLTNVLVEAIEAKDLYTKGHSARVAKYAHEIAYRMGYNQQQLRDIYLIALLHDVGKMGIPDAIINKTGRLDDKEYLVIRRHPNIGAQILQEFPLFAEGAKYHHERYDGKGYPDGLSGHNIPEAARIIAVADSYDAMTSNRSYRQVMDQVEVRREIIRGMGTQFDPNIANYMIDIIDEDKNYDNRQHPDEQKNIFDKES